MTKLANINDKISKTVVNSYKKVEKTVVEGYKQIEKGAVDGFNQVSDKCIEVLFAKENETIEEAKERLSHK